MKRTFGQRLKQYRKSEGVTQQDLAETIGVSTQAVSKWETDTGMPDISQIVPLSRALNVSTDVLLGVTDENDDAAFLAVYGKCMELERCNPCKWPPEAEKAEQGFRMMYDFFSSHPTDTRAAKYLLDLAELYWGKFHAFEDEAAAVRACERFANCIFRYSDDADLHAEARFLIASVWTRAGQKEKANDALLKMPFRYGDRCYWSAEVAKAGGDWEEAEALCKESFTYRARFIGKCLALVASLPSKTQEEKLAYEEYMLRLVNAFLSGGGMPYRQIYQKLTLLSTLLKRNLHLGRKERAAECFEELLEAAEAYIAFLDGGSKETGLLLLDDGAELFGEDDPITLRREMVWECLRRAVRCVEQMRAAEGNPRICAAVAKAAEIRDRHSR